MLTLSGSASLAAYQTALDSVTFSSTSLNPTSYGADLTRAISWQVNDGTLPSAVVSSSVNVVGVDQAPVLSGAGNSTAYTAGGPGVAIDNLLAVSDPDNLDLASATVTISGNFQAGDQLIFTNQNGISGSYNSATGVLTLTGSATVAQYQTALDSVTFSTSSVSAASRTVSWQVSDGTQSSTSPASTVTITIQPPALGGAGVAATYTQGGPAQSLDTGLTVSDPSSANLVGATVAITSGLLPGDTLGFTNQNGISGVYSSTTGVLTLSGSASLAAYQTALDSVTFSSTSLNPTNYGADLSRAISWQVNDGTLPSAVVSSSVNVVGVDQAPVLSGAGNSTAYTAGAPGVAIDNLLAVSDPDNLNLASATVTISNNFQAGDDLFFTAQNGIVGNYNSATGVLTLTGSATVAQYQTALDSITFYTTSTSALARTVSWQVSDGTQSSTTAASTVTITIQPPALGGAGVAATYIQGGPAQSLDTGLTVSDPSSANLVGATVAIASGLLPGDTLNFTNQGAITGSYNAATGVLTLSGTATLAQYQTALDSITFSTTSLNPTYFGTDTARAISWQVNDGTLPSAVVSTSVTVVGGPAISDSLPNIVANLAAINADTNLAVLNATSGTATLSGPPSIVAPAFSLSGSGTALTISWFMLYAGALTVGSGATISVTSGATMTTTGAFSATGGGTVNLSGGYLTLSGANSFNGATVTGAYTLMDMGTTSISGLAIGGTATFENTGALTQSGGTVTVGDASGAAAILFNAKTGTYDITDDSGVAQGTSTPSLFANFGLFEKTVGTGTSTVQTRFASTGTVTAATGTIAFSGATNNFSGTIGGAGAVSFTGGVSRINAGTTVSVASLTATGASTTLVIAGSLSYAGSFSDASGATLAILSGATLSLSGTATLSAKVTGAGSLAITGGTASIMPSAAVSVANLSVTGAATTLAIGTLVNAHAFSAGAGATVNLSGGSLVLYGANSFSGATVTGAHTLFDMAASSISGLTIGGTVTFQNNSTLTQSGGTVTVGDASGSAATLFNAKTGIYDITDDSGVAQGTSTPSLFANFGLFEKTGGTSTSTVQTRVTSTGTVTAATGTIAFSGATNNFWGIIGGAGAVSFTGGVSRINAGTTVNVASLTATGASTTLVIAGNLSYAGSFSDASGATLAILSGATLSLSGTATLSAKVTGAGSLAITGGTTSIMPSAAVSVANLSVTGAATTLAIGTLVNAHAFSASGGATLNLSGGNFALTGANSFSGAMLTGAHTLYDNAASSVSGLTIGGTVTFQNNNTLTQSGGTVTVGDSAGDVATLFNATTGIYDITDNSGIALGTSTASLFANNGLFEKTGGTSTSVIAPRFYNGHAVSVSSGTLDFAGAVTGTGTDTISGGATLEFELDGGTGPDRRLLGLEQCARPDRSDRLLRLDQRLCRDRHDRLRGRVVLAERDAEQRPYAVDADAQQRRGHRYCPSGRPLRQDGFHTHRRSGKHNHPWSCVIEKGSFDDRDGGIPGRRSQHLPPRLRNAGFRHRLGRKGPTPAIDLISPHGPVAGVWPELAVPLTAAWRPSRTSIFVDRVLDLCHERSWSGLAAMVHDAGAPKRRSPCCDLGLWSRRRRGNSVHGLRNREPDRVDQNPQGQSRHPRRAAVMAGPARPAAYAGRILKDKRPSIRSSALSSRACSPPGSTKRIFDRAQWRKPCDFPISRATRLRTAIRIAPLVGLVMKRTGGIRLMSSGCDDSTIILTCGHRAAIVVTKARRWSCAERLTKATTTLPVRSISSIARSADSTATASKLRWRNAPTTNPASSGSSSITSARPMVRPSFSRSPELATFDSLVLPVASSSLRRSPGASQSYTSASCRGAPFFSQPSYGFIRMEVAESITRKKHNAKIIKKSGYNKSTLTNGTKLRPLYVN